MELLYLYIPEYKSIKDQEYNFSNRYRFSRTVSEDGKLITIDLVEEHDVSNQWQTNFFGKKISNLTVIVGANGTGKSTLLEFINNEMCQGGNSQSFNFFAIFNNQGKFAIKFKEERINYHTEFEYESETDGMPLIQYFPLSDITFANYYYSNPVGVDRINISDNALFFADYEREKNLNRNEVVRTEFQAALSPFVISNIEREIEFFVQRWFIEVEPAHILRVQTLDLEENIKRQIQSYEDSIIKWEDNEDLREKFISTRNNLEDLLKLYHNTRDSFITEEEKIMRAFLFMLLIDVQYQLDQLLSKLTDETTKQRIEVSSDNVSALLIGLRVENFEQPYIKETCYRAFKRLTKMKENFANISDNAQAILDFLTIDLRWALDYKSDINASNVITELQQLTNQDNVGSVNLYFQESSERTIKFLKSLKRVSFINRLITYEWRDMYDQPYHYSTGQKQMIKLFSRLNYALNHLDGRTSQDVLVLLDEAELGMHPEWQRKFISWVLKYLNKHPKLEGTAQLIVTSHSPLMLSDIPSQNVIRLSKKGIVERGTNSFGANLFDLMKDSFFLNEGFMGEFAQEKINSVIEFIQSKDPANSKKWTIDSARSFINLIGEPLIREELRKLFLERFHENMSDSDLDEEIRWIEELKKKKKEGDDSN